MVGRTLSHYRILKLLGRGGMGEVYLAKDENLGRRVALKVLAPALAADSAYLKRFEREARAAAAINHPNIVTIYSVEEAEDVLFLTMELVEGNSLGASVSAGGLPVRRFLELAIPLAAALAEAHEKGIVHRDLKPGNIMVTDDGRVKVLDFGLAKVRANLRAELSAEATTQTDEPSHWPTLTAAGQIMGTMPYMSPEQVQGQRVDPRSDVFSLAVVLYEIAIGKRPFEGDSAAELTASILRDRPAMVSDLKAEYPRRLGVLVQRCLEKDPALRFSSARDVRRELEAARGDLASAGIPSPRASGDVEAFQELGRLSSRAAAGPQPTSSVASHSTEVPEPAASSAAPWGRQLRLAIAVLLFAGVAATHFLTRWWLGEPLGVRVEGRAGEPIVSEPPRIVLADYQNHTGETLLDDSIELAFRVGLERSRFVAVLPRSQIVDALARMQREPDTVVDRELGIEISQREDARALVIGAIGKIGGTYSLSAEVVDPLDGTTRYSTTASATESNAILLALERVIREIRLNLGESLAAIEATQRPLEKVATKDLEALKAYSVGVEKIAEGEYETAIQLLQRAIEIDPEFAMAYAKLATLHTDSDYEDALILETLDQALRWSDRLTDFEELYVEGWAARLRGEPEKVIATWTMMSTLFPEKFAGHFNLGMSYFVYFENYEEAAKAFEAAARAAQPQTMSKALVLLGVCQVALERYEEARSSFERASDPERQTALLDLHLAARDYPAARSSLELIAADPSRRLQILGRLRWAQYHADLGDFRSALREARLAGELAAKENLTRVGLLSALTLAALQDQLAADATFHRTVAVEAAEELISVEGGKVDRSPVKALALAGKLAVRAGDVESAAAIDALISPLVTRIPIATWRGYALMLQGELFAAHYRGAEAVASFQEALSLVDSFQVHESLAHYHDAAGDREAAIAEYEWLTRHRGRALIECRDECQPLGVIGWATALYRLGRLHEQDGRPEAAVEQYRRLLERQSESLDHPIRLDARRRLEALESTRRSG